MNYNHDTEQDLDWAADQLRRKKNAKDGLPDTPIRRVTSALQQDTLKAPGDPSISPDSTLGNALSGLAIHAHNAEHCRRICVSILGLLADRDRVQTHAEFVELRGVEAVLEVVKTHNGEARLVALQLLEKLSRTSARRICAAGGVDVVVRCCDQEERDPRLLAAALRVLHGLTFDGEAKLLLLRRGVRGLAEAVLEAHQADKHDPDDVDAGATLSIAARLLARVGDGNCKGFTRKWDAGSGRPLAA